ncbi:acetate--CoA ligase family protein [Pelotomaculum isophthalicicum JI]|uniref:Acetate--CoA ligase family protein n=1 Tax=Pelotomaculum isophthalicicum JI TaxID=947010 RepID=A0A9X4H550_9FIRM|nr:acetate--CoA ligase family protein [Pelotomaculum isophthalicicum]MDF9409333.1 acetate--CoA ligase family protein [Pelotomaculum isophthalicicum JI]
MDNSQLRGSKAMNYLFYPRSIAIIGASANPAKPGGMPIVSLINNGYTGSIYPVNPKHVKIAGLPCYPSLSDIPDEVDLAVIAVSAQLTQKALHECAAKKVKAAIVFTSGFAEVGGSGIKFQEDMAILARESDIALCGPNCMGIFNAQNAMTAGFVISELPEKVIVPNFFGFISQSGGFGAIMHAIASDRGIGFTYFISSGNETDLQFADYLAYMVEDAATKVIGGYLEGIKDGRKLFQAAEMALQAKKPVILIKTGRHPAAARAASSHTGALAGSDRVYSSFFKQKGIIRAESVEEFITILSLLAGNSLPRGNKVGIIVGSGGNGVLLADKCVEAGLEVGLLSTHTQASLSKLLPSFGTTANPIDMTSRILTDPTLLRETTNLVIKDPGVDMLIILHWASRKGWSQPTREIVDLLAHSGKPVLVLVWGSDEAAIEDLRFFREHQVPAVREIDYAARSLAALAKYSAKVDSYFNRSQISHSPMPDREKTAVLLKSYKPGDKLSESQSKEILRSCGILTTRESLATNEEEAVKIAAGLGCHVALKIDSPDIPHKTEAGGVKLNIETPEKIKEAYREIIHSVKKHNPDALIRGILVQEMLTGGIEVIAGISRDPVFGPTVMFGLGGIFVEALEDVSLRIAPLNMEDTREMIGEIKGFKVLSGLRGKPPADQEAIVDVLLKLSQISVDFPQINELDINPLFVFPKGQGVRAADVLITI